MRSFKGIKGPWNVVPTYKGSNGFIDVSSNLDEDFHVLRCTIYGEVVEDLGNLPEKTLANALLISKAPEMLEMLEKTVEFFDEGGSNYSTVAKFLNEIKELIKEATEL